MGHVLQDTYMTVIDSGAVPITTIAFISFPLSRERGVKASGLLQRSIGSMKAEMTLNMFTGS
jgi:hypothetical protein